MGWYLRDTIGPLEQLRIEYYRRMDGTSLKLNSILSENCPNCGGLIICKEDMTRIIK
jgi:hypothetical protein